MAEPRTLRVAVVGATGAAGSTLLGILEERGFPVATLVPLASAGSRGRTVAFRGEQLAVAAADEAAVAGCDVVFLAAGASTARRLAPAVAAGGGLAVDKSSAFREDPGVPLVVPEVNAHRVSARHGILANPNCVATPTCVVLAPLHARFGLRRLSMATYQAASGAGRGLLDELGEQQRRLAAGSTPEARLQPHVLAGNVLPGGWPFLGDDTEEELKVVAETRRVLELPELPVSITTVRVPVAVGHSAALVAEFETPVAPATARELLAAAPGVRLLDDPAAQRYPTPLQAAGGDEVLVGRLRADLGGGGALALFWSCDNLRKGAALNAVQVAELALRLRREAAVAAEP